MYNKTFTISDIDMGTILNQITYDDYARLYRQLQRAHINRKPTFEEYKNECCRLIDLESFTDDAWRLGYELVSDLFQDNEDCGTPCDVEATLQRNIEQAINMLNTRAASNLK